MEGDLDFGLVMSSIRERDTVLHSLSGDRGRRDRCQKSQMGGKEEVARFRHGRAWYRVYGGPETAALWLGMLISMSFETEGETGMSSCVRVLFWVFVVFLSVTAAGAQRPNSLSFEDGEEGWLMLWYGSDLDGWTVAGDAEWKIEDDAIVSDSGGMGFLITEEVFDSFELKLDFLADLGTNSGVFLRVPKIPANVKTETYELNIAPPDNPFPTGSLVQRVKVEGVEERAEWRSFHVVAHGGHFEVTLDGKELVNWTDPNPVRKGMIALQHNQGRIAFRNIKFRYLDDP